ncbi:MAG: biotin/lipoyl-containing protein [bacterium]
MKIFAKIAEKEHEIEIDASDNKISLLLNGETKQAELKRIGDQNLFSLIVDNHFYQLFIEQATNGYVVSLNGSKYRVELEDEKTRQIRSLIQTDEQPKGQVEIKAPMPGLIVKINVEEGQEIKKGESLLIIEAMKMENEIRADVAGKVIKILKNERDSVEKDMALMMIG